MKEKKLSKASVFNDEDKQQTSFEKFESDVKTSIFNVLYHLLKGEESSYWKHIIIILLDYIQLYYYSFAVIVSSYLNQSLYQLNYPWHSEGALYYWQVFLQFFQINYWLEKIDLTTYLVFFYICVFALVLVLLDFFYVSYSLSRKNVSFVWPLQALRVACGLMPSVLFLPILDTFTTMIICDAKDGTHFNTYFPDFECWHGVHIIHSSISIVASILFMIVSILVSLTFFDSQSKSSNPTARINSRADTFILLIKIVLVYLYAFFGKDQYQWFLIAILITISYSAFMNYRRYWPYYNDNINRLHCLFTCIFLWANLILLICKILEKSDFSGGLQLYFLGLPIIVALIFFEKDERNQILTMNINNFQRGEEVALQIRYFLYVIQTKENNRRSAVELKGYVFHHEDNCPHKECQLKQYKAYQLNNAKTKKASKKSSVFNHNLDSYQILLSHAKNMFRAGIQKFPDCTPLKIHYALFLLERMNRKGEALSELTQAANYNPPFDEQFIIYRYKQLSDDIEQGPNDSQGAASDLIAKLTYESNLKHLNFHIERSAQLHLQFWSTLREDRPDMAKLNDCGNKINQSLGQVENYWNQLQKLSSNNPKALKLYAKFLVEILNDKEGGSDMMSRAKDASNVKMNMFDGNAMGEDLDDINAISSNGTPCIYVTGEGDKIGLITQCNAGSSRIFGYTLNEMKNHNVEKLMPEMYAKNHSKVLDDALAKGPDNIPNKERLVFARHKSGYIFPVWLQLKMVNTTQSGVQFVALFKIDKKIMSSGISYILINKEKKIHGISSSCMKMLNLDIFKMRRLSFSGIDISKLAPRLFADKDNFMSKSGNVLDWHVPDFDLQKSQSSRNPSSKHNSSKFNQKVIGMSNQKLQFHCSLNTIIMGDLGEIGWYLKLENIGGLKVTGLGQRSEKHKEKVRQPLFQFRYEPSNGRFIREIKLNASVDNAYKNPNFANGEWSSPSAMLEDTREYTPKYKNEDKQGSSLHQEESKVDLSDPKKHEDDDLLSRKQRWGVGIQIYKLVGDKFFPKDYDEDLKKQQQIEEERKRKHEEIEKNLGSMELMKNSIKSRKALQQAINDKSTPPAIRNLRITMNIVILCLLALAISEFVVMNSQFQSVNENFNLVQKSYQRISEVQRISYNVRQIILINEGKQTVYKNYTTKTDFVEYLKTDMEEALNNLYSIQNDISLTALTMSENHTQLTNTQTVNLYFKDNDNALKILVFSLTEAVLQVSSAIFTARHLKTSEFKENQEDVFFITYNVNNDFLQALRQSSQYYVEGLTARAQDKVQVIMILFFISLGILVLTMLLLFPVVRSVNETRMKVLSLFVDIPNYHVINLFNKCERFLTCMNEDQNDEIETEDDDGMKFDDSDVTLNPMNKRGGHKVAKNSAKSSKKFFIQLGCAVLVVLSYYLAIFLLSLKHVDEIQLINKEMNALGRAESYYAFAQNILREMVYNSSKPILNQNSFQVTRDTIIDIHSLNQVILKTHFDNRDILGEGYTGIFEDIYQKSLCAQTEYIQIDLIPFNCDTYIQGAAKNGLQTVLIKYFETIKDTLKTYVQRVEAGLSTASMFNSNQFLDLYIIQFRFIKDSFRRLVKGLTDEVNEDYKFLTDTRMAAFVIFFIGLVICYLILWTPFVNRLNNEVRISCNIVQIWRTKSMLTIIPIEVILKIPKMHEFLNNQTFFSKKDQKK